jgi:pimeloyl-ACP methyl ester carboxylesterase
MTTWVLLRGLTREAAHWGDFPARLQALEPGSRVFAPDLPGAGTAHRAAAPLQVGAMVEHVRQALRAAGAGPPYRVLGLSLGGMVAAEWALSHPAELSHCVLVSTSMRPLGALHERLRPACWPALLSTLCTPSPQAAERRILQWTSARAAALQPVVADWVAVRRARPVSRLNALRQLMAAARYRLPDPSPAMPVLVLAAAGDRLVNPVCSQRLADAWRCAFALHPQAGHDLPLDDPAWVCAQLRRWLSAAPSNPGAAPAVSRSPR